VWNIIFYEKEDDTSPVKDFLESLPPKHRAKAMREINLLEEYGISLIEPHAKHIKGKLWELRIESAGDISRIFYFAHVGKKIVLLHGFVKKTRKTPAKEIGVAGDNLEDYLRRYKP